MATVKEVNYTPEQTQTMLADYKAMLESGFSAEANKAVVEALAVKFGKATRSIVAKLSREGVYQKAERLTKTGEKVEKKDQTADAIGKVLNMTEPEIESLTKANKTALKKIFAALANSKPI